MVSLIHTWRRRLRPSPRWRSRARSYCKHWELCHCSSAPALLRSFGRSWRPKMEHSQKELSASVPRQRSRRKPSSRHTRQRSRNLWAPVSSRLSKRASALRFAASEELSKAQTSFTEARRAPLGVASLSLLLTVENTTPKAGPRPKTRKDDGSLFPGHRQSSGGGWGAAAQGQRPSAGAVSSLRA